MRRLGAAAWLITTGLVVAGCGSGTTQSAVDPAPTEPAAPAAPAPSAAPPPTPASGPRPAQCGEAPLAVGNGTPDAATGHRYLALEVRNCTERTVTLDQAPSVVPVLPSGRRLSTPPELLDGPGRVELEPGALAYVGLEWLAGGRTPRWADAVEVTVEGLGTAELPIGNFDVNKDTASLRIYPWTTRTDDIWLS